MSWKQLRRLLVPRDPKAVFRSNDPTDPRLSDLLGQYHESIDESATTVVVIGSPQHIGIERNNGRPGAAGGPAAIRYWLDRMATSAIQKAVTDGRLTIIDAGDLQPEGLTLQQIHDEQHDVVQELLELGVIPVVLGGGHDTAWPTISALESEGVPFGLINVDAHADVRMLKDGTLAHSGSPFRQMLDAESTCLVDGGFVEFGLQHYAVSREHLNFIRENGHRVMMLDEIREQGASAAWATALEHLRQAERLYVTLDMDGFASAHAPGVSAPSTDGFTPAEIGPALRRTARDTRFAAFDVVETSPPWDTDGRTAKLAAAMIMQVLAGVADRY